MSDQGASREEQLLSACMSDQSDMVQKLLADPQPPNVNHTNAMGLTAMHFAVQTGSLDCVELLAKVKGIDVNIQNRMRRDTPLHIALTNDDDEDIMLAMVSSLVKAGADPDIVNMRRQSPFDLAAKEDKDIQRWLMTARLTVQNRRAQASNGNNSNDQDDDDDEDSDEGR
ncbi:hypothetical protein GGF46_003020 [Coemansia sp. RSA 552]|nr:hypothetical protein GGF46_003020 [Coemansia sp. RSA 552]